MGERRLYTPTNLRAWRVHRGLTIEQLAEGIDVSVSLISMIERGERGYDQDFLESAAQILHTTPARILAEDPKDKSDRSSIIEIIRQIAADDLPKLRAVLDAFLPPHPLPPRTPSHAPKKAVKKQPAKRRTK